MKIEWFKDINFSSGLLIDKMCENDFSKEIRITMPKNIQMKEHKAPKPIVVQVLEGKINFCVFGKNETYARGDMIALEANVPHSLNGLEDSIIRLSLHKSDNPERAKSVPFTLLKPNS